MDIALYAALVALLGIAAGAVVVWVSPYNCRVVQAILAARARGIEAYREHYAAELAGERKRLGLSEPQEAAQKA